MKFSTSEAISIYVASLSFLLGLILWTPIPFGIGIPQVAIILASRHYRQGKLGEKT